VNTSSFRKHETVVEQFQNPPETCRPLQLILSYEQLFGETEETIRENLARVKNLGIGGLVVTVNQENYLRSEAAWNVLRLALSISKELGFRLWLYDEEGYPSGAAGGLVLQKDPSLEAVGLIEKMNGAGEAAYEVIPLYESTHATENFYQKRRYINILDPRATAAFIEATHEEYARQLGNVSRWFEAVFTDEPSLINAYVPKGKTYPQTLPWMPSLPKIFSERKGYDLIPHIPSLYHDVGEKDRKIRCDFYQLISQLCAENYFGQIQKWCKRNGVASSGHLLAEETLVWQTYFEGDPFACYRKMDIPGIDMILSKPEKIINENFFLVPILARSAARLIGKREVMCEISDFLGEFENHHATLDEMMSTAGILYALGITELVCMYGSPLFEVLGRDGGNPSQRQMLSAEKYRRYTDFVTRLKLVFSQGQIDTRVAVLHPIVSVWANFTPSDRSMYEPHPNERVRFIDESFTDLCRALLQNRIDFDIVDDQAVAEAEVKDGQLTVGNGRYSVFVLPAMDTVRSRTVEKVAHFAEMGGCVIAHAFVPTYAAEGNENNRKIETWLRDIFRKPGCAVGRTTEEAVRAVRERARANCELEPPTANILCTKLSIDDELLYFLVNTSHQPWDGYCSFDGVGEVSVLDPKSGECRPVDAVHLPGSRRKLELRLGGYQSLLIQFSKD
jgi:hypothetical protein